MPVLSISKAVRVEADGLIILPCPGGDRIIRRPVQFDRVYSNMTGIVSKRQFPGYNDAKLERFVPKSTQK